MLASQVSVLRGQEETIQKTKGIPSRQLTNWDSEALSLESTVADDLAELEELDDEILCKCLKERYEADKIYVSWNIEY